MRDSAGVQIVEHAADLPASLPEWPVDTVPMVDIGGGDDPEQDLDNVRGATRLGDGRIVVANTGSGELRIYDGKGKWLRNLGRKGEGPGEFGWLDEVWVLPGDTIAALDGRYSRISLFLPSGEFLTSSAGRISLQHGSVQAAYRMRDGRLLGQEIIWGEMKETSGPVRRTPQAILLITPGSGRLDTIAVVPGMEMYPALGREGGQDFPTIKDVEFGRQTVYTTDGSRIYLGTNDSPEIRVYEADGRVIRLIRSATPAEVVTAEHRAQREKETSAFLDRQRASEQLKAEWRKNREGARYAEVFPYYERLMVASDGGLWAERARRTQDEGRRYIVFDSAGRAVASVHSPDRVRPYYVGPEVIIGLWRDADEVNHIRVYSVKTGNTSP